MNTKNKIRKLLGLEIKLEQMKLENGAVLEADSFEPGEAVFVLSEENERIPVPVGEFELEDGRILVVAEEGIIAEIREAGAVEEEEMQDEPLKPKKVVESITSETHFEEMEENKNFELSEDQFNAIVAAVLKALNDVSEAEVEDQTNETVVEEPVEVLSAQEKEIVHTPEIPEKPKVNLKYNRPLTAVERVLTKMQA